MRFAFAGTLTVLLLTSIVPAQMFRASDTADNPAYTLNQSFLGLNGGTGFTAWADSDPFFDAATIIRFAGAGDNGLSGLTDTNGKSFVYQFRLLQTAENLLRKGLTTEVFNDVSIDFEFAPDPRATQYTCSLGIVDSATRPLVTIELDRAAATTNFVLKDGTNPTGLALSGIPTEPYRLRIVILEDGEYSITLTNLSTSEVVVNQTRLFNNLATSNGLPAGFEATATSIADTLRTHLIALNNLRADELIPVEGDGENWVLW